MAEPVYTFNTTPGQTIARHLLISYLVVTTSTSEKLAAVGKRVEESAEEYDWGEETIQDILGNTWTTLKTPTITQSFDGLPLDPADEAAKLIHQKGIIEHDAQALANQEMVIGHWYLDADGNEVGHFAERYNGCAVTPTGLGGDGGGNITMPLNVTYGGERILGIVNKTNAGEVTFTAATATPAAPEST